ncbi:MAG: hypothetical protein QHJ34_08750 [bacterium]|nr:hypothetical protein [candidate division KSB1 bacterium]MDH7560302.1 hypothetical protein [bacterium]
MRAWFKKGWLTLLLLVPAAMLLADAEDRQEREVGGVWCQAVSHVNDPVWTGKFWYMSGWGLSEAETAIAEIGLSSELSIDWFRLRQKDYKKNASLAYTYIAYNWCPPWQEVCYTSEHNFVVDERHVWKPRTRACIAVKGQ